MKTNTKKVINILLSLAMVVSMITAFGGIAMAAPVLSDASASIALADELITVEFESTEAGFASLRAWEVIDGEAADDVSYLNQYVLVAGDNSLSFLVDVVVANKRLAYGYNINVAAAGGAINVYCDINADKTLLVEALTEAGGHYYSGLYDETDATWNVFEYWYWTAAGAREEILTTAAVNDIIKSLKDAQKEILLKTPQEILALTLEDLAIMPLDSLKKNSLYTLSIDDPGLAPNGNPYSYKLTWKVNNVAFANIVSSEGPSCVLETGNKNGMLMITVSDEISGLSAMMVVMII